MSTPPICESLTAEEVAVKSGRIRQAAKAGTNIVITFHGRPMSHVVPDERWQQLQADLVQAQEEAARLRAALAAHGIDPEEAAVA